MKTEMAGLDFETFCSVDLKVHGAARYFESDDFAALCAVIAYEDGTEAIFDFIHDDMAIPRLERALNELGLITAQNASFERMCCKKLGFKIPHSKFIDSAVVARAWGAASHLGSCAPQLLSLNKVELGQELIRVFSIPNKQHDRPYDRDDIALSADLIQQWEDFIAYCGVDAKLSLQLVLSYFHNLPEKESMFEVITQNMNDAGWFVDMPLVHEMQDRYLRNLEYLEAEFRLRYDKQGELNFNSYPQLQKWCAARGVKVKSFDQLHVPKLIRSVERKINTPRGMTTKQFDDYIAVLALLKLKQERGGSSLSKLQTIIDHVCADGRLRGQYMHVGAGQTYRTSGRGVQMQNLTRLESEPSDVENLFVRTSDDSHSQMFHWDNDKLAHNIRQCFKAEHPDGEEIVGDFKSVESRGLAYLAGEKWKLDAYWQGKDIYKMLAMTYKSNAGTAYEDVTKEQRTGGKVGELACGYGAGASAIKGFAEKMGIDMDEAEAESIKRDWRDANPMIVRFWKILDTMLHDVVLGKYSQSHDLPDGGSVEIQQIPTPDSLSNQHPGAQSIELRVYTPGGRLYLSRVFHGCYMRGNDVNYYKPSELKGGDLWRARMTTPPHSWYKLYGGKIAGILTQSFCRELFFRALSIIADELDAVPNVQLIGQFHDEAVLEWTPEVLSTLDEWSIGRTVTMMNNAMSDAYPWQNFPLEADIKHAHRYIK